MKITWDESTERTIVEFPEDHEEMLWLMWDRKYEELTWGIGYREDAEKIRDARQDDYQQILFAIFNSDEIWFEDVEE